MFDVVSLNLSSSLQTVIGDNEVDDLLLIFVNVRTAGTLAITGYTGIDAQRSQDAWQSRWFYKVSTGGEAAPLATGGSSSTLTAAYVIRGVDTADPIGATANLYTAFTAVSGTSAAPTTDADNSLVIHGIIWDVTTAMADCNDINIHAVYGNITLGATYKATVGVIPTFTWRANSSGQGAIPWAIPINSASSDKPIRAIDGRRYVRRYGAYDPTTPTFSANPSTEVSGLTAIKTFAFEASN